MDRSRAKRVRGEIARLAQRGLDWVAFSTQATEILADVVPFQRSCWHTVDPGTVLITGSLNRGVGCSGSWLADHEYIIDDVNQWWFLARSGRIAGASSIATHGDLSRSARYRSSAASGSGDELRCSLVVDGTYWGATGLIRDADQPWFTQDDVALMSSLSEPLAQGFRRAVLHAAIDDDVAGRSRDDGPGVVIFDEHGVAESISPAAERWIAAFNEVPVPAEPSASKMVQVIATLTRAAGPPVTGAAPRSRVQTRSGEWLLLYGTQLSGGTEGRTAVIIQPATPTEVAPLVALAYGLSDRERQVTRLSLQGLSTKQMASTLNVSSYTVQDYLKSIFDKTGVRSRGELVGQVFLEHYVPQWERLSDLPADWLAYAPRPPGGRVGTRSPS